MTPLNIASSSRAVGNSLSGLYNSTNRLSSDVGGAFGNATTSWRDQLRPASFRGVTFGVFESQVRFGRKTQIHEYPFRNTVWVEDLGRAARRISFAAFLVGDDCIAQRDILIKACEDAAAAEGGELVHPTLGRLTVSLADQVTCVERWDRGRMFELGFAFIEQGARQFPGSQSSTGSAATSAAAGATTAAKTNFLQSVVGSLRTGIVVALRLSSTVQGWAHSAQGLAQDATSLVNYVQSLSGNFGRLFGQGTVRSSLAATPIQTLIAQGALARVSVQTAADKVSGSAAALTAVSGPGASDVSATSTLGSFADAALALGAVLGAVAPTPGDGLRVVAALYASIPPAGDGQSAVPEASPGVSLSASQAEQALLTASASLVRRGCAVALAQLAAKYQPISREDAQTVLSLVLNIVDAEITAAGDAGEDDTYNALRTMRAAVVQDLAARSASLGSLVTVSFSTSLPALVLAQRLYRDGTRSDGLVQSVNPVHPAFMPTAFQALAE